MLTKRTIVGNVIGGAITAIGAIAFFMAIGLQTIQIDDTFYAGEQTTYKFSAPAGIIQSVNITAESFETELLTPEETTRSEHKNRTALEWSHTQDGESKLRVKNTGQSDIHITGIVQVNTDPINFTYHILVIISGLVIVGFSAGFSVRKPRGF